MTSQMQPENKSAPWTQASHLAHFSLALASLYGGALVGGVLVGGCSEGDEEADHSPNSQDAGTEGQLIIDLEDDGPRPVGGLDAEGTCRGLGADDGCMGEVYEGESVPLDLYLMFDQSGSMATIVDEATGATRMDIVRTAIGTFLADEESVGLGAGIGYFGYQPLGETTCNPDDYAHASIPIGALPENADALVDSIFNVIPTGETPTGAAIRGACATVTAHRREGAGRNTSILLITDGEPKAPLSQESCAPTLPDAVAAAEQCFTEEGIRTYVLGVGPSLTNLRSIAEAGGTETAYLADADNAQQVLNALLAVRGAAQLPCQIPLGAHGENEEELNPSADATVAYLNAGCDYVAVQRRADEDECGESGGWYFDDAESPREIRLCETTCGDVKSTGRQLFYSIACPLAVIR